MFIIAWLNCIDLEITYSFIIVEKKRPGALSFYAMVNEKIDIYFYRCREIESRCSVFLCNNELGNATKGKGRKS